MSLHHPVARTPACGGERGDERERSAWCAAATSPPTLDNRRRHREIGHALESLQVPEN